MAFIVQERGVDAFAHRGGVAFSVRRGFAGDLGIGHRVVVSKLLLVPLDWTTPLR